MKKNKIQEENSVIEIKEESLLGLNEEETSNEIVSDDRNTEELKCDDCKKLFTSEDSLNIHSFLHMCKQPATNTDTDITNFENDEDSAELNFVLKFTNFKCAKCKLLHNILSQHPCTSLQKIKMCLDVKTTHENDSEINDYDDNSFDTNNTSLTSKLVEICAPLKTENNSNDLEYTLSENENAASEVHEDLSRQKKFKCKVCGKFSVSRTSLKVHISNFHIKKPSKCETCGKVFQRKYEWKQHVSLHGDNDLKCDFCEKSFVRDEHLEQHVYTTHKGHKEEEPRFICGTCSKAFTQCNRLKTHILRVHEGVKKHQCKICGMLYVDKSNLTKHVQRVHEKINMRKHMCETCGNGFTTTDALKGHIRVIHDGIRDHSCDQCGRLFSRKGDLNKHIAAVHKGQRNYNCEACGKTFAWKAVLTCHIKQVHEGQRNHNCPTCGNAFFSKTDMQRHIDSVHLGKKDVWKRKKVNK